jgi:hypothetical protein
VPHFVYCSVVEQCLLLAAAMKNILTVAALGAIWPLTGCGGDAAKGESTLEVKALVSERRIDVFVGQRGQQCHETAEFRNTPGCQHETWKIAPTSHCVTEACVREIRLERAGSVLYRSGPGVPYASFDLAAVLDSDARLVIDGCSDSASFALPAPSVGPAPTFSATSAGISVTAQRSSSGVFATASSLFGIAEG